MNNYSNPVTVTGNPASFEASGNGKLLSLSVPFSPIQDLHGYSSPWPAGGGKNKCVPDLANGQIGSNGSYVSNTSRLTNAVRVDNAYVSNTYLSAGTYTLSVDGLTQCTVLTKDASANIIDNFATAWHNLPYTFTMTAAGYVFFTVRKSSGDLNPDDYKAQIESGSTATSWEPYENICPITGRTGLSVYVGPTQDQQDATTYSSDWTSPAGTVYGGTVDPVSGRLTINGIVKVLDGNESFDGTYWPTVVCNTELPDVGDYNRRSEMRCSHCATGTRGVGFASSSAIKIQFKNTDEVFGVNNATGFATYVATQYANGTPVTVYYPLATPLTYQLTATQIALILGQNYVWSDSNEAVTLTYVIELFTRYTFIVNGNDYTGLVERDSYRTAVTPVYGETIQTLDGVGHTALLRVKGSLTVKLNPQTAAQTAAICADLLNAPCEVQYKCLQRNVNVTALMVLDVVSAMFLSRCLYLGQKWNDVDEIVLKEL